MNHTPPHHRLVTPALLAVVALALCTVAPMASAEPSDEGGRIQLPSEWSFRLDPGNQGRSQRWFDPQVAHGLSWQKLMVTAPWGDQLMSDDPVDPAMLEYHGVAWYWTPFDAPKLDQGQRLWLVIGEVKGDATLYINGQEVAQDPGGAPEQAKADHQALRYDITPRLEPGKNHIVVRVDAPKGDGGITRPAFLLPAGLNWVVNPTFTEGFKGWRLYNSADNKPVEPTITEGRRAGEKSVRFKADQGQTVILDQHVDQPLARGKAYRVSVWYRQQVEGHHVGKGIPLRVVLMTYPKRGKRQPHDKLWLTGAGDSTKDWSELTGVFHAQENYTGFRIGVFVNAQGVFDVSGASVSPATDADAKTRTTTTTTTTPATPAAASSTD